MNEEDKFGLKQPVAQRPTNKSASMFGDDSDEESDDDNFLSKPKAKSAGLFGYDSDDEQAGGNNDTLTSGIFT